MIYEDFKTQYINLFNAMMGYNPEQAGALHYAEKMAVMADAHPEWADKAEAEAELAS